MFRLTIRFTGAGPRPAFFSPAPRQANPKAKIGVNGTGLQRVPLYQPQARFAKLMPKPEAGAPRALRPKSSGNPYARL